MLTARYEELRRQALGYTASCSPGLGLVLFQRQGMVSWIRAWPVCGSSSGSEKACAMDLLKPSTAFDTRAEVVALLASMVLRMRKGMVRK